MSSITNQVKAGWNMWYAEWTVLLVVLIALTAGWGVRSFAVNQTQSYSANGITVAYPYGWSAASTPEGALRFKDKQAGGVAPVLEVRVRPLASSTSITSTLAVEADALALTRAQQLTAYRTLETDEIQFKGQPAWRVTFAYVWDQPNAFEQHVPVVMLGEDVLTLQQGRLVVFSRQASERDFEALEAHFAVLQNTAVLGK
jgi:hypothetical protein